MTTPSPEGSSPKKLNLLDLIPSKVPVSSSIGQLYVRKARLSELAAIEGATPAEIGEAAIRLLTNRAEAKDVREPLADEDWLRLPESDLKAIAVELAKLNGWPELSEDDTRTSLGVSIEKATAAYKEEERKLLERMEESLKSSYSFLKEDTLAKLQSQMADLAHIRNPFADLKVPPDALSSLLKATTVTLTPPAVEALSSSKQDIFEVPPVSIVFPEDTKLGRATLESVRISKEVAEKMDALVQLVAGLNQTVIQDVLPAWVKQVEADQANSEQAFKQASSALRWTQIAVIFSIVITFGATWWQIQVAQDIDRENSAQQKRVEQLMEQQLQAQRQLAEQTKAATEQSKAEAEKLQAVLDKLSSATPPPKR